MKRTLQIALALAAIGAAPLAMQAQTDLNAMRVRVDRNAPAANKIAIEREVKVQAENPAVKSKSEKAQGGSRKVLENLRNAYSYYSTNSPYVYDQGSGAYFRVQRGPDAETLGNLYLITSTDRGATWSAPNKYYDASKEGQARYPSIRVLNKDKSSNLSDITYVFYAPVLRPKGSANAGFDGSILGYKTGGETADIFFYEKPEEDNTDNQKWGSSTNWADDQSKPITYMAQTLLSQGPGGVSYGQYGQYGFLAFSPDVLESRVPKAWGLSVFRPSTQPDRSYNDRPNIGTDEEGTLYTLICNMFEDDINTRVPAVSKSMDGGKTWQGFMRMPSSILNDYFNSNGAVSGGIIAYGTQGFQVLGKDNFSYVFKVTMTTATPDTLNQIVEAYYANGSWGMRKVADYSGFVPSLISESSVAGVDTSSSSQLDNEIQYVRTLDGNLLVKYLDFAAHDFAGSSVAVPDIFVTTRKIGGNSWSAPINVTNDAFFDKLSWIPSSLPDLNNIPMIELRTITTLDENTADYMKEQRRVAVPQEIVQFNFSVSTIGVNEEQNTAASGISLFEAFPNPALNSTELQFSVSRAIETHIDLFNSLGEKVATLQNGLTAPGFHAVVLNTENLASGAYYYTISAGETKITKSLSVVK